MSIYDFTVRARKGEILDMQRFKGKVLLIVNTATGCGFTPQYRGLEELYERYPEKGLEILRPASESSSDAFRFGSPFLLPANRTDGSRFVFEGNEYR